jgi:hypothetical protein
LHPFFLERFKVGFFMFSFTFGHTFHYPSCQLAEQAIVFWLPPRYQAGGPRWSKAAIRRKLPVLQQGHSKRVPSQKRFGG